MQTRWRLATASGAAALLVLPFLASAQTADPAAPYVGRWRLAGNDPALGVFAGSATAARASDPAFPLTVSFRRVYARGGEDVFVARGRPVAGVLQIQRLSDSSYADFRPTTPASRVASAALAARGTWSHGRIEEELVHDVGQGSPGFLVIAHHGVPLDAPENTIDGFAAAVGQGARALELDVCITKDGEVVAWHDRSPDEHVALVRQLGLEGYAFRPWNPDVFSRMRRPIEQLTLAELRANYGYQGYRWRGGRLEWGRLDVEIPRAADVLRWAALAPGLERVFLDVKLAEHDTARGFLVGRAIAEAVRRDPLVQASGIAGRLVFLSEDTGIVQALRSGYGPAAQGELPRFALDHDIDVHSDPYASAVQLGSDTVSIGWGTRSKSKFVELIESAQRQRVAAWSRPGAHRVDMLVAWTLDDPADWRMVMLAGADAIITDRVLAMRQWLDGPLARTGPEASFAPLPPTRDSHTSRDGGWVARPNKTGGAIGDALRGLVRLFHSIFGGD